MSFGVTPSQTIGPFFHYGMDWEGGSNLVKNGVEGGRIIRIEGRVFDGEGNPVTDALIEIWQADASGRYAHPADTRQGPRPGRGLIHRGHRRLARGPGRSMAFGHGGRREV